MLLPTEGQRTSPELTLSIAATRGASMVQRVDLEQEMGRARQLPAQERAALVGYFNRVLGDIDGLHRSVPTPDVMVAVLSAAGQDEPATEPTSRTARKGGETGGDQKAGREKNAGEKRTAGGNLVDPKTGELASVLAYCIRGNFAHWDHNHDGKVSREELLKALGDPRILPGERCALYLLLDHLAELTKDGDNLTLQDVNDLESRAVRDRNWGSSWDELLDSQEPAVNRALVTGKPVMIADRRGHAENVSIRKMEGDGRNGLFQVTVGRDSFAVRVDATVPAQVALGKIIERYLAVPPGKRNLIHEVRVEAGANPDDAGWAREYRMSNLTSQATAGDGVITLWHGGKNLSEGLFLHETGHLIGQQAHRESHYHRLRERLLHEGLGGIPGGWQEAAAIDGEKVSDYGAKSPNEDFAEAVRIYLEERFKDPDTPVFHRKCPHRARILDRILAGPR